MEIYILRFILLDQNLEIAVLLVNVRVVERVWENKRGKKWTRKRKKGERQKEKERKK